MWIGTKGEYNSIGIKFHRKGIELILERKGTCIPMALTMNFQASFVIQLKKRNLMIGGCFFLLLEYSRKKHYVAKKKEMPQLIY